MWEGGECSTHLTVTRPTTTYIQYGHCLELEVVVAIVQHMLEHFLQAVLNFSSEYNAKANECQVISCWFDSSFSLYS